MTSGRHVQHLTAAQRTARFVVALALLVYEATIYDGQPRWVLVVIYGAMMGLPLANLADDLRVWDEAKSGKEGE